MFKLSDKDFKAIIMKMFQWAITKPLETNAKPENHNWEIGSFSKEIEDTKKYQMEILELKNIASEVRSQQIENTKEWVSKYEDVSKELI